MTIQNNIGWLPIVWRGGLNIKFDYKNCVEDNNGIALINRKIASKNTPAFAKKYTSFVGAWFDVSRKKWI